VAGRLRKSETAGGTRSLLPWCAWNDEDPHQPARWLNFMNRKCVTAGELHHDIGPGVFSFGVRHVSGLRGAIRIPGKKRQKRKAYGAPNISPTKTMPRRWQGRQTSPPATEESPCNHMATEAYILRLPGRKTRSVGPGSKKQRRRPGDDDSRPRQLFEEGGGCGQNMNTNSCSIIRWQG